MKIIILKSNLKEALSAVERAASENNNLPVLKNVLLKTYNNKIKIAATNLDLAVTKLTSGKIIEEGGITVPLSTFQSLVNNSDNERITVETEKNNLLFKTDNYTAKIQGVNQEEFPIIPRIESEENFIEMETPIFRDAVQKVLSAVQISEIRPEISGVLFDFQLTQLKLVSTDAFRLAQKTINNNQFKTNFKEGFKVIVPLKTITEAFRIFPDNQSIKIQLDPNQILFKNEDSEIISRLIDGEYPDYEQIIPKNIETETVLNREQLINAVKLASNFSGKTNDVKIKINDNKKVLEVYSANQYLGENNYLIPVKIKGDNFKEIAFNWRYFIDGLKIIDGENLVFGVNGENKPSIIKASDDPSYFYIVMPIKNV
ncbi:MAG: DNA polymerase III subunit beta [Candidatus Harrisonbacteria bacterium]|nr:DNA polymerase III subunit beta [Candidatus Harrisonbacteria bacterium]